MTWLRSGDLAPVPTGNTFDKYGSQSRLVRRLMSRFQSALDELVGLAEPDSVLDVGCGEGILTERWSLRPGIGRVVGFDLPDAGLRAHWSRRTGPNLRFVAGRATELPFAEGAFSLVAAIESLEHMAEPKLVLAEMARVSRGHLLVSVPREPVWRGLNLVRGAYLGALGNTPGHLQHWSTAGLLKLVSGYGRVVAVRSPLPWTMALVRTG